jgi:hypothetical protein
LPHWFHAATAAGTLVLELGLVFMMFFPRRVRLICFFIVTPWELGVIFTANYTFLNYLVLSLGFLLLDDRFLRRFVPIRFRPPEPAHDVPVEPREKSLSILSPVSAGAIANEMTDGSERFEPRLLPRISDHLRAFRLAASVVMLTWIAYDTTVELIAIPWRSSPLPTQPIAALDPFRIANQYGLFAVMTRGRYEIEFQGSNDGSHWVAYPFRYKPQAVDEAPRIYAPFQPRFEWNLWFASLGDWRQNNLVPLTEERLLTNDNDVVGLFRSNPFAKSPPRFTRAVLWQYWFTSIEEKRRTGNWWRREWLGLYAPVITLTSDGRPDIVQWADELPPRD